MRIAVIALVAALAAPAVTLAQDGPPPGGPPQGGMRGDPGGRQMQNTIEWLLTQKDQFRPSGEQVQKLEAAAKQLNDSIAGKRAEIRKLREEIMAGGGDRREGFEKMRPLMDAIRKDDELATKEALKVLNDEQQKVVTELLGQRRKEMESRRRMGGRPGQPS